MPVCIIQQMWHGWHTKILGISSSWFLLILFKLNSKLISVYFFSEYNVSSYICKLQNSTAVMSKVWSCDGISAHMKYIFCIASFLLICKNWQGRGGWWYLSSDLMLWGRCKSRGEMIASDLRRTCSHGQYINTRIYTIVEQIPLNVSW